MGTGQCKINKEVKEKVVGVNIIQKQNDPIPRRIEWRYLNN